MEREGVIYRSFDFFGTIGAESPDVGERLTASYFNEYRAQMVESIQNGLRESLGEYIDQDFRSERRNGKIGL